MKNLSIFFAFAAVFALIGATSPSALTNSGIIVKSAYAEDKVDPCAKNANDAGCGGGGGSSFVIGEPQPNLVHIGGAPHPTPGCPTGNCGAKGSSVSSYCQKPVHDPKYCEDRPKPVQNTPTAVDCKYRDRRPECQPSIDNGDHTHGIPPPSRYNNTPAGTVGVSDSTIHDPSRMCSTRPLACATPTSDISLFDLIFGTNGQPAGLGAWLRDVIQASVGYALQQHGIVRAGGMVAGGKSNNLGLLSFDMPGILSQRNIDVNNNGAGTPIAKGAAAYDNINLGADLTDNYATNIRQNVANAVTGNVKNIDNGNSNNDMFSGFAQPITYSSMADAEKQLQLLTTRQPSVLTRAAEADNNNGIVCPPDMCGVPGDTSHQDVPYPGPQPSEQMCDGPQTDICLPSIDGAINGGITPAPEPAGPQPSEQMCDGPQTDICLPSIDGAINGGITPAPEPAGPQQCEGGDSTCLPSIISGGNPIPQGVIGSSPEQTGKVPSCPFPPCGQVISNGNVGGTGSSSRLQQQQQNIQEQLQQQSNLRTQITGQVGGQFNQHIQQLPNQDSTRQQVQQRLQQQPGLPQINIFGQNDPYCNYKCGKLPTGLDGNGPTK
jgi:hypothetical protein